MSHLYTYIYVYKLMLIYLLKWYLVYLLFKNSERVENNPVNSFGNVPNSSKQKNNL